MAVITDTPFRAECWDVHWFMTLAEAKHAIESWRQESSKRSDRRTHKVFGDPAADRIDVHDVASL